jgi:hypothetical protein
MNLKKKLCMVMLTTLSVSCVFVAQESLDDDQRAGCHVLNKKLTLSTTQVGVGVSCHGSSEMLAACLVTYGVIVPVGSLIVSGSVVVVGNILNWIETQGRC